MREVKDGLNALIPFRGLWHPMKIGQFSRLLNIHCLKVPALSLCLPWYSDILKEMARYLSQVKQTWRFITGEGKYHQNRLDANTVHILQGCCPFQSLNDRTYIEAGLSKEDIFSAVRFPDLQKGLLERILSVEHTIPFIYTFLKETKCLEPGARILKNILLTKCKGSLAQAFRALHNGQARLKEQTGAFLYQHRDLPTGSEVKWLSYRQLWLFPLCHFPASRKDSVKWKRLSHVTGKRKWDNDRPNFDQSETVRSDFQWQWLRELALLASANKYRQIQQADHEPGSADAIMVKDFLLNIWPLKYYQLWSDHLCQKVQLICQVLKDIEQVEPETRHPEVTSDYDDCRSDIENQCGQPQEHSVKKDEENLFLNHIYSESLATVPKQYMTSFAWKWDMFHFFFDTSQNKAQRIEVNLMRDTDGNLREASPRMATSSVTSSEGVDENPTTIGSMGNNNEAHFVPSKPILSSVTQANTHSILPTHMKAEEHQLKKDGQREEETILSLDQASQLLFHTQVNEGHWNFTVLSLTENGSFRRHHVNHHNKAAILAALQAEFNSHYLAEGGKWLKLTDLPTIVKEAQSQHLKAVLIAPKYGVKELINWLEKQSN